jgi:hypothetical protein
MKVSRAPGRIRLSLASVEAARDRFPGYRLTRLVGARLDLDEVNIGQGCRHCRAKLLSGDAMVASDPVAGQRPRPAPAVRPAGSRLGGKKNRALDF